MTVVESNFEKIEHDLYLAERQGKPERGMVITFKREERRTSNKAV